jgi:uncharacterized protein (TIGR02300 family)
MARPHRSWNSAHARRGIKHVTEAALGTKRRCLSCGTAFFDLRRDPIICPRCQAVFSPPPPELPVYKRKTSAPVERVGAEQPEAIVEEVSEAPIEDHYNGFEPDKQPDDDDDDPEGPEPDEEPDDDDPERPEPDEEPDDDILPLES